MPVVPVQASVLLPALRRHLVDLDIVRNPRVAGSEPPLWLEPKNGLNAPGEGKVAVERGATLVLGAYFTGGFAPAPYNSPIRKPIVDIRFRGISPAEIERADMEIYAAIADKRDWMMDDAYVLECQQWRALSRLGSGPQGYEYVSAYWFELVRNI